MPSTKSEIELVERMGVQLISLSKACCCAHQMEEVVHQADDPSCKWSLSQVIDLIALDDFQDLISKLVAFASDSVVVFREALF